MNGDFAGILKGALALPEQDKRQLAELMARLTALDRTSDSVALQAREQQPEVAPQPNATEWLQTICSEPAWVQLQLLEEAIEAADDDPSELQMLRAAYKMLLHDNPPVAVRRAVVRVAGEHPIGICVGALGLLLALFALGRGVFHLSF